MRTKFNVYIRMYTSFYSHCYILYTITIALFIYLRGTSFSHKSPEDTRNIKERENHSILKYIHFKINLK